MNQSEELREAALKELCHKVGCQVAWPKSDQWKYCS